MTIFIHNHCPDLPPDPLCVPGTMEHPRLPADLHIQMIRITDAMDYAIRKAEALARTSWGSAHDCTTARPVPDGFRAEMQGQMQRLQKALDGICEPGLDLGYYDLADVEEGIAGCTGLWDGIYPEQRPSDEQHPAIRHGLIDSTAQSERVAA